jgi:hypothetical protein
VIQLLEVPGIEPGAFHMQSERATTALYPLIITFKYTKQYKYVTIFTPNKIVYCCIRLNFSISIVQIPLSTITILQLLSFIVTVQNNQFIYLFISISTSRTLTSIYLFRIIFIKKQFELKIAPSKITTPNRGPQILPFCAK